MRSIGDPDFIYSPWSEARRRAASARAKEGFFLWTDEHRKIAKDMWAAGKRQTDIAEALGTTKGTISGFIFRNRMSRTTSLPTERLPRTTKRDKPEPSGEIPAGSRVHLTEAFYEANQWHWRMPWGVLERYRWAKGGDRIVADVRWLGTYTCLSTYEPSDLEVHA